MLNPTCAASLPRPKKRPTLCILEQARVIYIDKIEPGRSVRMITRIGSSNPVHCTSVGKAILAFLPEERINDIIRRTRFERFTHRTIGRLKRCGQKSRRRAAVATPWMTRSSKKACVVLRFRYSTPNVFQWPRSASQVRRSGLRRRSCLRSRITFCNACAVFLWIWDSFRRPAPHVRRGPLKPAIKLTSSARSGRVDSQA